MHQHGGGPTHAGAGLGLGNLLRVRLKLHVADSIGRRHTGDVPDLLEKGVALGSNGGAASCIPRHLLEGPAPPKNPAGSGRVFFIALRVAAVIIIAAKDVAGSLRVSQYFAGRGGCLVVAS